MHSSLMIHSETEASSKDIQLLDGLRSQTLLKEEEAIRGRALVLYDGVCGLCNRVVHLLLRYDRADRLRYAPLDSDIARAMLRRHPSLPQTHESAQSVIVFLNCLTPRESVHQRSDAVLAGMRSLPKLWKVAALLLGLIPRTLRDSAYRIVARLRYRLFGRYATCPIPTEAERSRILGWGTR